MTQDIIIRPLRIEDYDNLIKLWNDAGLIHRPRGRDRREAIAHELQGPQAFFLVAEKAGELVGSIFGTHDGRRGWINRLAVAPACRKQGIAARLVHEVEEQLFNRGIGIISCLVEDWNIGSMSVFEKLGYKRHTDVTYFSKRVHPDI